MQANRFERSGPAHLNAMRIRTRAARWGLCALLLPLAAGAGQSGPVTLRMKFKAGDITKYRMTMQMTMDMGMSQANRPVPTAMQTSATMVQQQKVDKVFPDGGGEITTTTLSQKVTLNDRPGPAQNIPPITTAYDARGNVRSIKGLPAGNPAGNMLGGMFGSGGTSLSVLPTHAVKPGDTWTSPISIPVLGSGTAHSTFVRVENVGRFRTARIHTVLNLPIHMMMDMTGKPTTQAANAMMTMTGAMNMAADTNIAIAEGKLIRTTGGGAMTMNFKSNKAQGPAQQGMPGGMKMNMKMDMTIVP